MQDIVQYLAGVLFSMKVGRNLPVVPKPGDPPEYEYLGCKAVKWGDNFLRPLT